MSEDQKKDRREFVALLEESSKKVDRWIEQAELKCNVKLSRKSMLNWFLAKSSENLSNSDLSQISEKFYDDEKFLRQLLRKVKKAREDGGATSLEVVIRQKRPEQRKESQAEEETTL